MDFSEGNPNPPRNYFNRREQWRLLVLVMSLGLVILLMIEAAKPKNWYWLTGDGTAERRAPAPSNDNYDTSYQPTLDPNADLETVRILSEPPDDDLGKYFPGVQPTLLQDVKDFRPFQPREAMAWFNLLGVLANTDSRLINDNTTGRVSFIQLFEQPKLYRGELVTVAGSVRRVEWLEAGKNGAEIDGYYRVVIRPKDGPPRPIFVYALDLPKDFPVGDKLHEEIEATGFFYKNWPYVGPTEQAWIAPVVLSRDFAWFPAPSSASTLPPLSVMLGITLLVALFGIGVAWYVYRLTRMMFAHTAVVTREVTASEVEKLKEVEVMPPVESQLRQLAEREK